jgi:hypothetical protein
LNIPPDIEEWRKIYALAGQGVFSERSKGKGVISWKPSILVKRVSTILNISSQVKKYPAWLFSGQR